MLSDTLPLWIAVNVFSPWLPIVPDILDSLSSVGVFVIKLTAPPIELLPKYVVFYI